MTDMSDQENEHTSPEDIDQAPANAGEHVDTATGEIVPASVAMGRELDALPSDLGELAALFGGDQPSPVQVVKWILAEEEYEEVDPEETSRSIIARILASDTLTDVLAGHKVVHARDILQVPIIVHDVKWQRSTLEGGSSCYAVLTAEAIDSQQPMTVTTSGRNVMVQLVKLQMNGWLPARCRITMSDNPTARGFRPLWLEPA